MKNSEKVPGMHFIAIEETPMEYNLINNYGSRLSKLPNNYRVSNVFNFEDQIEELFKRNNIVHYIDVCAIC